jgi:NADPH-dependent ferric siderophore reductase
METSILYKIRKKAGKIIENQLLKTGRVLDVRYWESSDMIEIDLHLPTADMHSWNQIPYIKLCVDDFTFRDYTPFGWDADIATCSLLVDADHDGPGSRWAKSLRTGDTIHYLKMESTRQAPHPTDFVVGLGDASSLGHLLALQQLTMPKARFDGAVLLPNPNCGKLLSEYFSSPLHILPTASEITEWLLKQGYCTAHTWFYLIGNDHFVSELRRLLKSLGHHNIRVKGFWS